MEEFQPVSHTFSIKENLTHVPESYQELTQTRYNDLKTYLHVRYDTLLRDDSRMAWIYISNPNSLQTLDDVARELWYMKLLYAYSDYPEKCRQVLPTIKHNLMEHHAWFPLSGQRAWEHIQNFVIPLIKLESMVKLIRESKLELLPSTK